MYQCPVCKFDAPRHYMRTGMFGSKFNHCISLERHFLSWPTCHLQSEEAVLSLSKNTFWPFQPLQ